MNSGIQIKLGQTICKNGLNKGEEISALAKSHFYDTANTLRAKLHYIFYSPFISQTILSQFLFLLFNALYNVMQIDMCSEY